ncbi:MAG TPA: carboxymuconolactone decarboxylase family protein, partial [Myxococcota bacterium]|nr:carboxymuconolactone decarboxylase family protein [Myxococcota bacterium]
MTGSRSVQDVEWEGCLLEWRRDPAIERRFERETGRPLGAGGYLLGVPWIEEALLAFSLDLEARVALDAELADLTGLVVSQDNSCRYCFAAMRAFLRILGMPEEKISRLERDLLTADFSPRERAALRFARRLSRSDPLCGADEVRALREAGFT